MTPERIRELLQILWETAGSTDDLQRFYQTYGQELDGDFLAGIIATIERAREEGNEEVALFFDKVGKALISILRPSEEEEEPETEKWRDPEEAVRRSLFLIQVLFEDVNSDEDLFCFATHHLQECDETFFAVLQHVIDQEKVEGNEGNVRFFQQVAQALQDLRQHVEASFQEP